MSEPSDPNLADAIEVEVVPMSGCAVAVLAVLSFGVVPLVMRSTQRNWPKRMDAHGFTTRAGRRYRWSDIHRLRKVTTIVNNVRTERWDLETDKATVAAIAEHRLRNGPSVLAFAQKQIGAAERRV